MSQPKAKSTRISKTPKTFSLTDINNKHKQDKEAKSKARQKGAKNWTENEEKCLVELAFKLLPRGRDEWSVLCKKFNDKGLRNVKDGQVIKKRFQQIAKRQQPTGNREDTTITLAHECERLIEERANIQHIDDTNDIHGDGDEVEDENEVDDDDRDWEPEIELEEGEALYFTPPTQEHTQIEATSQLPTQIVDSSSQLNMTQSTQPPESRTIYAPVRDLSCAVGMTSLHNETNSANTTPRSQKSHRTTTPSPSTTPSTIKKVIVTQNKRPLPDTTTTNETETTQPRAKKAVTVLHDINGTFALRAQQQQEQAHQQQQSMLLFAQQMREDRLQQQQYQQCTRRRMTIT